MRVPNATHSIVLLANLSNPLAQNIEVGDEAPSQLLGFVLSLRATAAPVEHENSGHGMTSSPIVPDGRVSRG